MSIENRIEVKVSQEASQKVEEGLNTIKEALKPYLVALPPEEKKSMVIVGDKLNDFIEKGLLHAQKNPDLVPPYLKLDEVQSDQKAWSFMRPVVSELEHLLSMVKDTGDLCGNEAYSSVLSFYHYVKQAAKDGVPGAKPIYEDLKSYFPSKGSRKNKEEEEV